VNAIYKYAVPVRSDEISIVMPRGAQILSMQKQRDGLYLWALVDTEVVQCLRKLRLCGTGYEVAAFGPPLGPHIATTQQGDFVWHFFDQGEDL